MHLTILRKIGPPGSRHEESINIDRWNPNRLFFGEAFEVMLCSDDGEMFEPRVRLIPGKILPGTLKKGQLRPAMLPINWGQDWVRLTELDTFFGLLGTKSSDDEDIQIIIVDDPNPFGEDE